ncbi:hypothetical protein [Agromyces sp. SYSU T00194]|uniref:hypothetical protein n=1 Tax=Agromyces chitinivorans TaxID=3158560 RepID=UPI00339B2D98
MTRPSGATVRQNTRPIGPSRRTVLRAATWSTPVIAIAAAVPLAAASAPLWQLYLRNDVGRQQANEVDTIRVILGLDPAVNPNEPFGRLVAVVFTLDPDYYTGAWTGQNVTPTSGLEGSRHSVQAGPLAAAGSSLELTLNATVLPEHRYTLLPAGIVDIAATATGAGGAQLSV